MITDFNLYTTEKYKLINNKIFTSLDDIDINKLHTNDIIYIQDTKECRDILEDAFCTDNDILDMLNTYQLYVGYNIHPSIIGFKYSVKVYCKKQNTWYYFPSKYCFIEETINAKNLYKPKNINENNKYKIIDNKLMIPIDETNVKNLKKDDLIYIEDSIENRDMIRRRCGLNEYMYNMFNKLNKFYDDYDGTLDVIKIWNDAIEDYYSFPISVCYIYKEDISNIYKPRKKINETKYYKNYELVPITEENYNTLKKGDKIYIDYGPNVEERIDCICGFDDDNKMLTMLDKVNILKSVPSFNSLDNAYIYIYYNYVSENQWADYFSFPISVCYIVSRLSPIKMYEPKYKKDLD